MAALAIAPRKAKKARRVIAATGFTATKRISNRELVPLAIRDAFEQHSNEFGKLLRQSEDVQTGELSASYIPFAKFSIPVEIDGQQVSVAVSLGNVTFTL